MLYISYTVHCKAGSICIPRNETERPRCQFPHPCICEWFIYFHNRYSCFLKQNRMTGRGNICIHRSQKHECGIWERGRVVSFLGIFLSNFRCSVFAMQGGTGPHRGRTWSWTVFSCPQYSSPSFPLPSCTHSSCRLGYSLSYCIADSWVCPWTSLPIYSLRTVGRPKSTGPLIWGLSLSCCKLKM